ncbi:YncE family protein [Acetonema longum]|uniref:Uncharacterized protein n=1 Tax=Acetonema longum DSM 6540 TaxID=1009370 RepID=F7NL12_9FIRM|nr:hypothetical protein [Acetonema longum]EGO63268.1 hypothetical protein ALO_13922 [Acetonema longum DSM 6540]
MVETPYSLLLIDTGGSNVFLADGPSGQVIREWPFPKEYTPLDIILRDGAKQAYILAAAEEDSALFQLDIASESFARLPVALPTTVAFALSPISETAYLVNREGSLHSLNLSDHRLCRIGQADSKAVCTGLAADQNYLYSIWRHETGGLLATFTHSGRLMGESLLPGIPTHLALSNKHLLIPFTASQSGCEGVFLLPSGKPENHPTAITLHCCREAPIFKLYPCFAALSPDETTSYIVCEDSATVCIIDIAKACITGSIPVGRSLSSIALTPGGQLAVGGSHMFADLSLIDLVNERLLSITDCNRELFGKVVVVP